MQYDEILDEDISYELNYTLKKMKRDSLLMYVVIFGIAVLLYFQQQMWVSVIPSLIFFVIQMVADFWKKNKQYFIYKISEAKDKQSQQIILSTVNLKGDTKEIIYPVASIQKTTLVKQNLNEGKLVLDIGEEEKTHRILMKDFLKVFPKYLKIHKYQ